MSLPKGSENPPKKAPWMKPGWVIKKVVNPPHCCCMKMMSPYPPRPCPKCKFYPCYADAYGTYRCPRCDYVWKPGATAVPRLTPGTEVQHPPRRCPVATCQYYPCYWDATAGCYRCPRGHLFP
jgi:hypothetical protein